MVAEKINGELIRTMGICECVDIYIYICVCVSVCLYILCVLKNCKMVSFSKSKQLLRCCIKNNLNNKYYM